MELRLWRCVYVRLCAQAAYNVYQPTALLATSAAITQLASPFVRFARAHNNNELLVAAPEAPNWCTTFSTALNDTLHLLQGLQAAHTTNTHKQHTDPTPTLALT